MWRHKDSSVSELNDLIVYAVDELSCCYTIGDIAIDAEPHTLTISIDQDQKRITVWICSNSLLQTEADWDYECAMAIADEWKIGVEDVLTILSSSSPLSRVEKYLVSKGIPDIASLKGAKSRPFVALHDTLETQVRTPSLGAISTAVRVFVILLRYVPTHYGCWKQDANICLRVVDNSAMKGSVLPTPQQPSYIPEWRALIEESEPKLHSAVRNRSLTSDVTWLQAQFACLDIQSESPSAYDSSLTHLPKADNSDSNTSELSSPGGHVSCFTLGISEPNPGRQFPSSGRHDYIELSGAGFTGTSSTKDFTTGAFGEYYASVQLACSALVSDILSTLTRFTSSCYGSCHSSLSTIGPANYDIGHLVTSLSSIKEYLLPILYILILLESSRR